MYNNNSACDSLNAGSCSYCDLVLEMDDTHESQPMSPLLLPPASLTSDSLWESSTWQENFTMYSYENDFPELGVSPSETWQDCSTTKHNCATMCMIFLVLTMVLETID